MRHGSRQNSTPYGLVPAHAARPGAALGAAHVLRRARAAGPHGRRQVPVLRERVRAAEDAAAQGRTTASGAWRRRGGESDLLRHAAVPLARRGAGARARRGRAQH